ncbi:hypothetical protein L195_g046542 [Trifolium pratense]|uniref:Uncharacterized protein n=1 Tax=Trifolium pratense TaxID=57577 RepID=A0A2K3MI09_TRIPR|nr:hypothetical protein L195_g046542 [Trifolium pratense]
MVEQDLEAVADKESGGNELQPDFEEVADEGNELEPDFERVVEEDEGFLFRCLLLAPYA